MRSDYRLSITIFVVFLTLCVLLFNVFWLLGSAYILLLWQGAFGEEQPKTFKIAITILFIPLIIISFGYMISHI